VPIWLVNLRRGLESLVSRSPVGGIQVKRGIKRLIVKIKRQAGEDDDRKRRRRSCLQLEGGARSLYISSVSKSMKMFRKYVLFDD